MPKKSLRKKKAQKQAEHLLAHVEGKINDASGKWIPRAHLQPDSSMKRDFMPNR